MPRSIFVSHVFEDRRDFLQVKAWAEQGHLGDVVVIGESRDVRQAGEPAVEAHLQSRIRGAAIVLVLVGESTHNHRWVQYELSFATAVHKPVLGMRIPGTAGPAPEHFRNISLLPFNARSLRAAVERNG